VARNTGIILYELCSIREAVIICESVEFPVPHAFHIKHDRSGFRVRTVNDRRGHARVPSGVSLIAQHPPDLPEHSCLIGVVILFKLAVGSVLEREAADADAFGRCVIDYLIHSSPSGIGP
jgi:hypothetical protein